MDGHGRKPQQGEDVRQRLTKRERRETHLLQQFECLDISKVVLGMENIIVTMLLKDV